MIYSTKKFLGYRLDTPLIQYLEDQKMAIDCVSTTSKNIFCHHKNKTVTIFNLILAIFLCRIRNCLVNDNELIFYSIQDYTPVAISFRAFAIAGVVFFPNDIQFIYYRDHRHSLLRKITPIPKPVF